MSLFELTPRAANEWSASGDARFERQPGRQFGGYVSGLMMAAVLTEPQRRGTPVAMTGVFMAAVANAPMAIRTQLLRSGNSMSFWQADIVQEEKLCAQSTITLAQRPQEGASFGWIEMPDAPPPEQLASDPFLPTMPAHRRTLDHRSAKGWPPEQGDSRSWTWVKDLEGHKLDYPRLAMYADMFPPRSFYGTGLRGPSSTVSFTIYFHAPEDELEKIGSDYILLEASGRRGSGGTSDLTAALWRRDGFLLVTTEQLCWFR